MKELFSGVHQFHSQVFQRERDFFDKLVAGQSPSTLFVTCSDSRVDPNLITQSGPGELFVLRNAGNIVPPYGASNGGESATIEYAVAALGVRDIVICGHSRCGAVNALLHPEKAAGMPLVSAWLNHAETTRRIIQENYGNVTGDDLVEIAVQDRKHSDAPGCRGQITTRRTRVACMDLPTRNRQHLGILQRECSL